jgi:hypothetical protein
LYCQNGKKIVGNFENGEQKGLKTKCSGIDQLLPNKGLFYLKYNKNNLISANIMIYSLR